MVAVPDPPNDQDTLTWNSYGQPAKWLCWDDGGSKSWRITIPDTVADIQGCSPDLGTDVIWLDTITSIERDGVPLTQGVDWVLDEDPGSTNAEGTIAPWKFIQFTAGMGVGENYEIFGTLA